MPRSPSPTTPAGSTPAVTGWPRWWGGCWAIWPICDPREQSIAELAEALLASRSAIAGAVKTLEQLGLVRRSRAAGERMDRVGIDLTSRRALGFDPTEYQEQAALAREGLAILADAPPERRAVLLEWARDGRVAGGTAARVGEGLAGPPRGAARGGRTPRRHDAFLTARRHDDPVQRGDYRLPRRAW
jgi:DNA-binding Lrp family transcriptional regulator